MRFMAYFLPNVRGNALLVDGVHQFVRVRGVRRYGRRHLEEDVGLIHIAGEEERARPFGGHRHARTGMIARSEAHRNTPEAGAGVHGVASGRVQLVGR